MVSRRAEDPYGDPPLTGGHHLEAATGDKNDNTSNVSSGGSDEDFTSPVTRNFHGQLGDVVAASEGKFDGDSEKKDNTGVQSGENMEKQSKKKKKPSKKAPNPELAAETPEKFWATLAAQEVIETFPNEEVYTLAAGISPSGPVHFGNFRDVMTVLPVLLELQKMGKKTRFIFSWDNFDRFRKVPHDIKALGPEVEKKYADCIGMPLSKIPDPKGEYGSYAARFQAEFESAMQELGIEMEYRYQTQEYESGRYDDQIVFALQNREAIGRIILSFMSDKGKAAKNIVDEEWLKEYYPISIYSKWTGKDNTEVLSYDGQQKITYRCLDTGNEETIDLKEDHIIKLVWKTDWPMRWCEEGVNFEPGGHDHASPGSSFDVSSIIVDKVFGRKPPVFRGYQFIGVRGDKGKMSSSKGNAPTPAYLLQIYEPTLLRYLYLSKPYDRQFTLEFGATEMYRIYDELDRAVREMQSKREAGEDLTDPVSTTLLMCRADIKNGYPSNPIPFRQAASFGAVVNWDFYHMMELLKHSGMEYDENSVRSRLEKAKHWLETYNPEEEPKLLEDKNQEYFDSLDDEAKEQIKDFTQKLSAMEDYSVEAITELSYAIPKKADADDKENKIRQRNFYKHIYNLLIGKNQGPRLGTFLWALSNDMDRIINLLNF